MKKIVLIVAAIAIVTAIFLYLRVYKNARTYYEATAEINPASLSQIKTKLENAGCSLVKKEPAKVGTCSYREEFVAKLNGNGLVIYPKGMGFGPVYFYLTENKILNYKDIPGSPNKERYKEEVEKEIEGVGNAVQIKEETWEFNKIKYPWTTVY